MPKLPPKIKIFLKKVQSLPLERRKTILWAMMAIFALLFVLLYIQIVSKRWESVEKILPASQEELAEEATTTSLDFWLEAPPENQDATSSPFDFGFSPETQEKAIEFLEALLKELKEPKEPEGLNEEQEE